MASETAAASTETVEDLDENVGEARWYKDSPVVLKKVPNKGRGLFARYPLKKGDPLLKSAPYAWATYEPAKVSYFSLFLTYMDVINFSYMLHEFHTIQPSQLAGHRPCFFVTPADLS